MIRFTSSGDCEVHFDIATDNGKLRREIAFTLDEYLGLVKAATTTEELRALMFTQVDRQQTAAKVRKAAGGR